MSSSLV